MNRTFRSALTAALLVGTAISSNAFAQPKEPVKIKPALVVIDIQNEYLPRMDERDSKGAMEMINWTIGVFREMGLPIIRVYHTDPSWGPKPGTEAFEFPSTVNITKDDPQVIKNYPDAFKKTNLEKILKEKGVNTLFLCGLSSVGCVLATYHGAADLDYSVFMVKDAIMCHKAEYTDMIEDICNTVGYAALQAILQGVEKK